MRITNEMLEARDRKGNLVNFVFCSRCVKFYHLGGYKKGDDISCQYCRTDEHMLG